MKNLINVFFLFVILTSLLGANICFSQSTTTVTTYIVKTQEKRKSTRFTLTEWLRIKERMKMMDVWLAMFSSPKDEFSPELNVKYSMLQGGLKLGEDSENSSSSNGTQAQAQLWLTNLVSSSTRIRTVNIDFGIEARSVNKKLAPTENEDQSMIGKKFLRNSWMANFRLFGKNIQDSSLVFKAGKYLANDGYNFSDPNKIGVDHSGDVLGLDMQLYVFRWLGVDGNYYQYKSTTGEASMSGAYYDYMAYIEISLLRIMAGKYEERWENLNLDSNNLIIESGLIAGIQLQF